MTKRTQDQRNELISLAVDKIGSEKEALVWFDTYELPGFGHTAAELFDKGYYGAVREFIVHADDGYYA